MIKIENDYKYVYIFFLISLNFISGKPIHYTGDPLKDFTLIRFLDRYVFKNPKKLTDRKYLSDKENNPLSKRASYVAKGVKSLPVNSKTYLNENEDKIPADELFLYKYLNNSFGTKLKLKKEDENLEDGDDEVDDDDLESVNSEEFNTMLDGLAKDKDFDDMDIAGEISSSKKKRKKGNKKILFSKFRGKGIIFTVFVNKFLHDFFYFSLF